MPSILTKVLTVRLLFGAMFDFLKQPNFFLSLGQFFGISAILSLIIFQLVEEKASSLEFKVNLNRQLSDAVDDYFASLSSDQLIREKDYSVDMVIGTMQDQYFAKNMQIAKAALPKAAVKYHKDIEKTMERSTLTTILDAEAQKSLLATMTIKLAIEELLVRLDGMEPNDLTADLEILNGQNENTFNDIQKVYFENYESFDEKTDILALINQFKAVNLEIDANVESAFNILWKIRNHSSNKVLNLEQQRKNIISMSSLLVLGAFLLQLLVFLILQSFEYREGRVLYE